MPVLRSYLRVFKGNQTVFVVDLYASSVKGTVWIHGNLLVLRVRKVHGANHLVP